jgi:hypothetical protein
MFPIVKGPGHKLPLNDSTFSLGLFPICRCIAQMQCLSKLYPSYAHLQGQAPLFDKHRRHVELNRFAYPFNRQRQNLVSPFSSAARAMAFLAFQPS